MPVVPNPGRQRQRQVVNPGYPVGLYLKIEQAKQTNKKIKENKKSTNQSLRKWLSVGLLRMKR